MKSLQNTMLISGGILLLLFLAPLGVYMINFRDSHISSSPGDWGTFGDYLGGFLNPVLAVINILVLVYLTFRIAHDEENRTERLTQIEADHNTRALKFEKDLAINQIKLDAYKEISNLYLRISCDALDNKDFGREHFMKYKVEFHLTALPYVDLFKSFNVDQLNTIGNTIFDLNQWRERQQAPLSEDHTTQINLNKSFIEAYTKLLNELRLELFDLS